MNDVLPKPFTKEGMLRTLEKHLAQFKKNYIPPQQVPQADHFGTPNTPLGLNMGHMSATQSLKEEPSPGKSGSPTSSWHSPQQMGNSPSQQQPNYNHVQQMHPNQGGQYMMTPTHNNMAQGYQTANPPTIMAGPVRQVTQQRGISDMGMSPDEPMQKRQRMFPPSQGGFTR
jgi:osomolarity two-component system response regulator SKN7